MPLFTLYALDKPNGGAEIRAANRPAHLEWAGNLADKIKMAGPLLSDDGEHMIGSLFIFEADSLAQMKAIFAEDPYAKAGLFHRVEFKPVKWLVVKGLS